MATAKEKLIASAQKLVDKGAFEKAIKEYLRVVQEDDSDVRIWLKIGDLYKQIGKKTEAIETYQRVAQFYSDQGFYLKSVAVYKQILKLDPRLVDVNQRLAELYKQLGLISDAIHQYEQVAGFFHKEGRVRDALTAMKQIVDLDPETVAARIKLAEMYSRENMPREAIEEFTKAAEQLKEQGRVDEYMKVAERLLFHSPDNRPVTKELARLYIEKNDPRRALPKLQVLFKADPRDLDVLRLLARAFEGLEQRPKAVSVYKELARILTETGDQRGATDVFRQIQAIQPDDSDAEVALRGQARGGSGLRPGRKPTMPPPPPGSGAQRAIPSSGPMRSPHATGADQALDSGGYRAIGPATPRESATVRPGQLPSRSALPPAPADNGDDVVNEEIAKILSETDVYIKYNLHAKAIEHLQRVFERVPRHIGAREKLKALYVAIGKKDEALLELWALAESVEPTRARRYIHEIYELDPSNARAAQILGEPVRAPGYVASAEDEEPNDDFGVAAPSDFGLPNRRARQPERQLDPPTRRGQKLEPIDEVQVDDELIDDAPDSIADPLEQLSDDDLDLESHSVSELLEDPDDDLIPVVIDTGAQRAIAEEHALEDDSDRFSLDPEPESDSAAAERSSPTFKAPISQYEQAGPDAETRFGPLGVAPAAGDVALDLEGDVGFGGGEEAGTAQMQVDEFASFDDPARPAEAPEISAELSHATDEMSSIDTEPQPDEAIVDDLSSPIALRAPPSVETMRPDTSLEDDLDESDFFMQQSLFDEARGMLQSLLERFPNHPLVTAKLRDLDVFERGAVPAEEPPLEPMPMDSALSAQLPTDLPGSGAVQSVLTDTPSGTPVEVTRRGVIERGVSAEDFETHYDLGIAYKEMGLIDDAVAEFRIVMKDTAREVQCQLMIGLCYIEKQMFTEAINQFKKGLYVEGITDPEALSLYYELGQAYEKVGDPREALYYYDKVQKRDPKFRELQKRIRALRVEEPEAAENAAQRNDELDAAFDSLLDEG